MNSIKVIIPRRLKGERLDSAISGLLPNISRSKISLQIKSGEALINNKNFKPNDKVVGDEIVSFVLAQKKNNNWTEDLITERSNMLSSLAYDEIWKS